MVAEMIAANAMVAQLRGRRSWGRDGLHGALPENSGEGFLGADKAALA
jgi:hypothetical protein